MVPPESSWACSVLHSKGSSQRHTNARLQFLLLLTHKHVTESHKSQAVLWIQPAYSTLPQGHCLTSPPQHTALHFLLGEHSGDGQLTSVLDPDHLGGARSEELAGKPPCRDTWPLPPTVTRSGMFITTTCTRDCFQPRGPFYSGFYSFLICDAPMCGRHCLEQLDLGTSRTGPCPPRMPH